MFKKIVLKTLIALKAIPKPELVASIVDDHPKPEQIKKGQLILVRAGTGYKWACFKCPGGCGVDIKLPLSKQSRPQWNVSLNWLQLPTVMPSVHQTAGCRCHFWIKKGHIDWCKDIGNK